MFSQCEWEKTLYLTGFNGFRREISDAVWRILYLAQLTKLLVARCIQRRVVGAVESNNVTTRTEAADIM
jgi:hypothetical protein